MKGRNNNDFDRIIRIVIFIAGAIVALGIIKWLFAALFKIAVIIVAIAIVVWVFATIFGAATGDPKTNQSFYVDERGIKHYTKKPVSDDDIVVESRIITCPGCNISLSSGIEKCPKCGIQIK